MGAAAKAEKYLFHLILLSPYKLLCRRHFSFHLSVRFTTTWLTMRWQSLYTSTSGCQLHAARKLLNSPPCPKCAVVTAGYETRNYKRHAFTCKMMATAQKSLIMERCKLSSRMSHTNTAWRWIVRDRARNCRLTTGARCTGHHSKRFARAIVFHLPFTKLCKLSSCGGGRWRWLLDGGLLHTRVTIQLTAWFRRKG